MDQHDAENRFARKRGQRLAEPRELRVADPAGRHERRRRHRGRKPDQHERAAPANEGISAGAVVAMHEVAPLAFRLCCCRAHIGVVIAGDHRHVGWRAERRQPGAADEFLRERDIGEVAGDSDGAGRLRFQVGDDLGQHGRIVDEAPPPLPVDVAGQPLADEFAPARRRQRRQMRVGEMGEGKHRFGD